MRENNNEPNPTSGFEIPNAVDFSDATEQQLDVYFDLTKEALEAYYRATLEIKPFPSFKILTTEYCQKYLEMKFKYESMSAKNVVSLIFEVKDWKITDNALWCEIHVEIEFRYLGAAYLSGRSFNIQIIIENPQKPIIADWYDGDPASFDAQVRSHWLDLSLKENQLSNQNMEEILSKGQKVLGIRR